MAYAPLNLAVFTAAFAGALAGMGASGRVISDPLESSYNGISIDAFAFAQSFDTTWGLNPVNSSIIDSIKECSESVWEKRSPNNVSPFNNATNYNGLSSAVMALVKSGNNYLNSLGIYPL